MQQTVLLINVLPFQIENFSQTAPRPYEFKLCARHVSNTLKAHKITR